MRFMVLPQFIFEYSLYIILAIYLIFIIIGMVRGFVLQIIDLVGLLVGIVLAWVLSAKVTNFYMFIPNDLIEYSEYLTSLVQPFLNRVVWFFILLVVIMILIAVLKPLIKAITELPVLRVIDRVLGGGVGIIMATLVLIFISSILSTPIFDNGSEFIEQSELVYVKEISDEAISYMFDNYITDENLEKFFEDNDIEFDINEFFENSDISALLPIKTNAEEIDIDNSEDNLWKVTYQEVIDEKNLPISAEDLKKVVDYNFSDEQLQQLIDQFNINMDVADINEIINSLKNNS